MENLDNKKENKTIIYIIACALLIIVGFAGYRVFFNSSDSSSIANDGNKGNKEDITLPVETVGEVHNIVLYNKYVNINNELKEISNVKYDDDDLPSWLKKDEKGYFYDEGSEPSYIENLDSYDVKKVVGNFVLEFFVLTKDGVLLDGSLKKIDTGVEDIAEYFVGGIQTGDCSADTVVVYKKNNKEYIYMGDSSLLFDEYVKNISSVAVLPACSSDSSILKVDKSKNVFEEIDGMKIFLKYDGIDLEADYFAYGDDTYYIVANKSLFTYNNHILLKKGDIAEIKDNNFKLEIKLSDNTVYDLSN